MELVSLIYDAAADASRWRAFLDSYIQAVGGRRAFMVMNTEPRGRAAVFRSSNWPDDDFRLCAEWHTAEDFCRIDSPVGAIWTIDDHCPAETLEESSSSTRFRYGLAAVFLRKMDCYSTIIALRSQQDDPFGQRETTILRALMPHLQRAALLQSQL